MTWAPKSLTATVHIRFDYPEPETSSVTEGQTEMMGTLLNYAADLDPELQELLIKFANYLKEHSTEGTRRGSG